MRMIFRLLVATLVGLLSIVSQADPDVQTMNGFRLGEFGDFVTNWHHVTVRYRIDSEEMREVWANDLAWNFLRTHPEGTKEKYPDGAVFAKIGIKTGRDEIFPSSVVPSGARRFQFMVRDQARFDSTGGWGYVLFNSQGRRLPGEERAAADACFQCHKVAAARGDVFSQIASFNSAPSADRSPLPALTLPSASVPVERFARADVPRDLAQLVPAKFKEVLVYSGPIAEKTFAGTFEEIIPSILEKSRDTGLPVAFISKASGEFVVAVPRPDRTCTNGSDWRSLEIHEKVLQGQLETTREFRCIPKAH